MSPNIIFNVSVSYFINLCDVHFNPINIKYAWTNIWKKYKTKYLTRLFILL